MSSSWPDPFKILTLGLLPVPTGYAFLFESLPPVMIVIGLIACVRRHRRVQPRLMSLLLAASIFIIGDMFTIVFAERYSLSYERSEGCPAAPQAGFITLVPLFLPSALQAYSPSGARFDHLRCDEYDQMMWEHAAPGLIATLFLIATGLSVTSFGVGSVFSWFGSIFIRDREMVEDSRSQRSDAP